MLELPKLMESLLAKSANLRVIEESVRSEVDKTLLASNDRTGSCFQECLRSLDSLHRVVTRRR